MLSIVSFSVGAPVMCEKVQRGQNNYYDVVCPKILDPNDIIKDMNFVGALLRGYRDGSPRWTDLTPIVNSINFIAETLKNHTETLNSFISPPPPPPSPPPPSPPPSRCYHWQELFGEGKTQKLLCKLGI
jgi:hypothetical protein